MPTYRESAGVGFCLLGAAPDTAPVLCCNLLLEVAAATRSGAALELAARHGYAGVVRELIARGGVDGSGRMSAAARCISTTCRHSC